MRNKDKLNLGLIALVLILVAFGVGYFANSGPQNLDMLGWNNSTDSGESQYGGSPGGGDQPPNDDPEPQTCTACNGHGQVAGWVECTTCSGRGTILQGDAWVDCPMCEGGQVWGVIDCSQCLGDGTLDTGDPGYGG
ncbi:MAG: hypothetical protein FJ150_02575 [Euryarchaeota archaeon]|nr:hypothetical protein [Euryarchaeota archaeon]